MIDLFVRSLLGNWGQAVLNFYLHNSLWINALLLLYFALLVLAQWSYRKTLAALLAGLKARYGAQLAKKSAGEIQRFLKGKEMPWESALAATRLPLIASPRSLIPRPKTLAALQKLFPPELLAEALKAPAAESPAKSDV